MLKHKLTFSSNNTEICRESYAISDSKKGNKCEWTFEDTDQEEHASAYFKIN